MLARTFLVLLLAAFTTPAPVQLDAPDPPGPIVVGKKGKAVTAGDTLQYTVSWGPGARATSYGVTWSVAATNGAWSVVADSNASGRWITGNGIGAFPQTSNVTFLNLKSWIAALPWDSATFTVRVVSKNAIGTSAPVSASWQVRRVPGPPGPITIDSSLIVIGVLVKPDSVGLFLGGSRIMCEFSRFGNGAIAQRTIDRPSCDSIYTKYIPAAARAVSIGQQAHMDSLAKSCVTWTTPNPAGLRLEPVVNCSGAVKVTGLQLSWKRFPADVLRYASIGPAPTPALQ